MCGAVFAEEFHHARHCHYSSGDWDLLGGASGEMRDDGVAVEDDSLVGLDDPVAEVDLFVVHEESLVEASDLIDECAFDDHGGSHDLIDVGGGVVGEVLHSLLLVVFSEDGEASEEGVSVEGGPEGWESSDGVLDCSVGVEEFWPAGSCVVVGVHESDEFFDCVGVDGGVGVQEEEVLSVGLGEALVVGGGEASVVGVGDYFYCWEEFAGHFDGAVGACVVDDDYFEGVGGWIVLDGLEASFEVIDDVPTDYYDRQLQAGLLLIAGACSVL